MRRSTTSGATDRLSRAAVGLLLAVELIGAGVLLARLGTPPPPSAAPTPPSSPAPATSRGPTAPPPSSLTLRDGRTVDVTVLGGLPTAGLAVRVTAELDGAADAVTAFWGDTWPRHIVVILTGTDDQFRTLGAGAPDIAATATGQRIVFAPRAADMSVEALRIVLRHELFHYAARADTAADAPRWLTEGVADFVARPPQPRPGPTRATELAVLPTDADLDTPGPARSLAYDRAWWFTRFVADRYGVDALRRLYVAACGHGHGDTATAIRDVLGADLERVLVAWRTWLAG